MFLQQSEEIKRIIFYVGNGRITRRFVTEARYVSGITVESVFGRTEANIKSFAEDFELSSYHTDYDIFKPKLIILKI